jgi:hypothetical protein
LVELPEELLRRKIELCENVLKVYNAINPGQTNERMNVIFELNCARLIETKIKSSQSIVHKHEAMVK